MAKSVLKYLGSIALVLIGLSAEAGVLEASDASFKADVTKHRGVVVVDFYATWCGPCRAMAPVVDELSGSFKDKVRFVRVDVDKCQSTAQHYHIQYLPTFGIFKDGKMVSTASGAMSKDDLRAKIEQAL